MFLPFHQLAPNRRAKRHFIYQNGFSSPPLNFGRFWNSLNWIFDSETMTERSLSIVFGNSKLKTDRLRMAHFRRTKFFRFSDSLGLDVFDHLLCILNFSILNVFCYMLHLLFIGPNRFFASRPEWLIASQDYYVGAFHLIFEVIPILNHCRRFLWSRLNSNFTIFGHFGTPKSIYPIHRLIWCFWARIRKVA